MNYKQQINSGDMVSWRRCDEININNPLNGIPQIAFHEEDIKSLPNGEIIKQPVGNLYEHFTSENFNKTFNVLNPADDSVIRQLTYAEVYAVMYSLYLHLADLRDNPPVIEQAIEVTSETVVETTSEPVVEQTNEEVLPISEEPISEPGPVAE